VTPAGIHPTAKTVPAADRKVLVAQGRAGSQPRVQVLNPPAPPVLNPPAPPPLASVSLASVLNAALHAMGIPLSNHPAAAHLAPAAAPAAGGGGGGGGAAAAAAAAAFAAALNPAAVPAAARASAQEKLDEVLDGDVGLTHTNSDEQTFETYVPTSFNLSCFEPHPDEIFETSSMSCLSSPKTTYKLNLCSQTILRGLLTNAQLEAISLACSQHELRLPGTGERAAFFLGDGPGVGKGRQAAGIIFENYLKGRKKGLWFSASPDLVADARRDLNDIGAECVECWNLKDFLITDQLDDTGKWEEDRLSDGVLFCTYTLLTSEREIGKRIDQIVEWCGGDLFEGPVILDECHKAKDMGSGLGRGGRRGRRGASRDDEDDIGARNGWGAGKATKTATFVAELQERLPLARIVYVSATGASEPKHFMQLSRLGLWGPTTSFRDAEDFVQSIKRGGVGAMELVAMHMKASGQYISRSLSFSASTFELVTIDLLSPFKRKYDGACRLWYDFIVAISEAPARPKFFMGVMWGAHQRFFSHMIMAAKVPAVVALVKKSLDEKKCCVIGLQSTGEASSEEASEKSGPSLDDMNSTAASNFTKLVETCTGFLTAAQIRMFLKRCDDLHLPANPLDDIIHKLGGPTKVAEMTGRKMRYVKQRAGNWEYVRRCKDATSDELTLNIEERKNFQDGRKLVAIISEAASSGISLQADRRVANQRRRVHITLQLPWAADQAVQQMGRSHRSNQTSAPEFKLLMTPIGGERRFASAVASRLQSLGALTRGDRRAAGTGGTTIQSFAIEGKYGRKALDELVNIAFTGKMGDGSNPPAHITEVFEGEEEMAKFCKAAKEALDGMAISLGEHTKVQSGAERLRRFLNRLLGVQLELQDQIFCFFSQFMEIFVAEDKLKGKYEEGISDVAGKNKRVVKIEKLYECPGTGAVTEYVQLTTDRGVSWDEAVRLLEDQKAYSAEHELVDDKSGFYEGSSTNSDFKYFLAIRRKQPPGVKNSPSYIFVRPNTGNSATDYNRSELRYLTRVQPGADVKRYWEFVWKFYELKCTHYKKNNYCVLGDKCDYGKRTKKIHLITGLCLPFWKDVASKMGCKVVRIQPDDGSRRLVGILLLPDRVDEIKDIIKRGTRSNVGREDRTTRMKDDPFLEETTIIKMHDCLNPTGQDTIPFDLPAGWDKAGDGGVLHAVVQIYDIPFQNGLEGEDDTPLYPTLWRSATQLKVMALLPHARSPAPFLALIKCYAFCDGDCFIYPLLDTFFAQ
jgi:hypothetical protein